MLQADSLLSGPPGKLKISPNATAVAYLYGMYRKQLLPLLIREVTDAIFFHRWFILMALLS